MDFELCCSLQVTKSLLIEYKSPRSYVHVSELLQILQNQLYIFILLNDNKVNYVMQPTMLEGNSHQSSALLKDRNENKSFQNYVHPSIINLVDIQDEHEMRRKIVSLQLFWATVDPT